MLPSTMNMFVPGFGLLREITDNDSRFLCAEWSPDGEMLALASDCGGGFFVWDEVQNELRYRHCGSFGGVNAIAWSPRGSMIAAGCVDGTVQVQLAARQEVLLQHRTGEIAPTVRDLKWLPDGDAFAVAYTGGIVQFLNASTGEPIKRFTCEDQPEALFRIAVSPCGELLAASDSRRSIKVWGTRTEQVAHELRGHWGPITCLDWASDGKLLAAGSLDATVYVWDVGSGELVKELSEPQEMVRYVRFAPDSELLAASSDDNVLRVWSCQDWRQQVQLPEWSGGVKGGLAFHPKKPILAAGAQDGHKVRLWEYDAWQLRRR